MKIANDEISLSDVGEAGWLKLAEALADKELARRALRDEVEKEKLMEANFSYEQVDPEGTVIIRDLGPWDRYKTITNAAEEVVVAVLRRYPKAKKILYYDSEGELDELKFNDTTGRFIGFAPGPRGK